MRKHQKQSNHLASGQPSSSATAANHKLPMGFYHFSWNLWCGACPVAGQVTSSPVISISRNMLSATVKGAYDAYNATDDLLLISCCCFCCSLCEARFRTQQPLYPVAGVHGLIICSGFLLPPPLSPA